MHLLHATALLLANAGFALGYSLPTTPRHRATSAARSMDLDDCVPTAGVQMYLNDDDHEACDMIRAEEPPDDPLYTCWLNPDSDSMNDYICVHEHPCLDIPDDFDHAEDSY